MTERTLLEPDSGVAPDTFFADIRALLIRARKQRWRHVELQMYERAVAYRQLEDACARVLQVVDERT